MTPGRQIRLLVVVALLGLTSCSLLPSLRIFQKKIDPSLAEKPKQQVEAERRGAKLIEVKSAAPAPDAVRQVAEIHAIAVPLSASLGEPAQPVRLEDQAEVIAGLEKGLLAAQKKADAWKALARKYAGHTIEGTGLDIAPVGGGFGLLLLVAGCIFVPGFGSLVLFVIRRLRGTVQQVAQGIEQFKAANPDQADALGQFLGTAMDSTHKAIVDREKQFIDWVKVTKAAAPVSPPAAPAPPAAAAPPPPNPAPAA